MYVARIPVKFIILVTTWCMPPVPGEHFDSKVTKNRANFRKNRNVSKYKGMMRVNEFG